ncbi:protein of unknown function [Thiomonas sp. OC7]|nr:protein of unknown function [Thiomonas sp. Sup16B3]VDY14441.1 protein of unknown function [Thiomonas sp. OC7]
MPNSHASQFSAESFPGSAPFFCKGDHRKIWTHRPIAVRPARDEMALSLAITWSYIRPRSRSLDSGRCDEYRDL